MSDKQKLVYIEFTDHGSTAQWLDHADIDLNQGSADATLKAVGWVIGENERILCLGSFICDWGQRSHTRQYIVKSAITKRRTLKVPR
jgi:hypothetical protein